MIMGTDMCLNNHHLWFKLVFCPHKKPNKKNKKFCICQHFFFFPKCDCLHLLSAHTTGERRWVFGLRTCDICTWSVLKQHVLPDTSGMETSVASICSLAPIGLPSVVHPFRSQQNGEARRRSNGANLVKWRRQVHWALKHSKGTFGR